MDFGSPFLNGYVGALSVALGAVMGSFLNAWAYRMVHGESIAEGRSRCTTCGHVLAARDLVPVVSYLALKGKCRYCGEGVSPRYVIVELLAALCFVTVVFSYGLTIMTLKILALCCVLLLLGLVDCDTYMIPDRCIVAGVLLALVPDGMAYSQKLLGAVIVSVPLLLIVLIADRVMGRETMGGGDIKLFFMVGAHLGPALSVLHLFVSCVFGIALYVIGKATRRASGSDGIGEVAAIEEESREASDVLPFGPAIGLACWFCLIAGRPIVQWYLSLFV